MLTKHWELIRHRISHWGPIFSFSIADQGLISGANFLLNIFLARSLSSSEYGSFALSYSIFLLISGFYNALYLEPLVVLGSANYSNSLTTYSHSVLKLQFPFLVLMGAILLIFGVVLNGLGFVTEAENFIGMSFAGPIILLGWLYRRFCYVRSNPKMSFVGSAANSLFLVLGIVMMYGSSTQNLLIVYILMSVAAAVGILVIWLGLKGSEHEYFELDQRELTANIVNDHWKYGKWILGVAILQWFGRLAYVPILSIIEDVSTAGTFRAAQNLIQPHFLLIASLNSYLLPWASKPKRGIGHDPDTSRKTGRILGLYATIGLAYAVFLFFFSRNLISFLYDERYIQISSYLILLMLLVLSQSVFQALSISIRAMQKSSHIFIAQSFNAALTMTIGLMLIDNFGIIGAFGTAFIAEMGMILYLFWVLLRSKRNILNINREGN